MFTGIIEKALPVAEVSDQKGLRRLRIDLSALSNAKSIKLGDSVALNGCCLTVAGLGLAPFSADDRPGKGKVGGPKKAPDPFQKALNQSSKSSLTPLLATFEAVPETLNLTNLGDLNAGSLVNVERAMLAGSRLDGHMVQGHVDATGTVAAIEQVGGERRVTIRCGGEFARQCIHKGSVCVDGISLTIAELTADSFTVAIIPHTWEVTNLRGRKAGERVNLESDVIGKYVLAHLKNISAKKSNLDFELMKRAGFVTSPKR